MKPRPKIRFFVNIAIIFCFIVSNNASFADYTDATQPNKNSGIKTPEVTDKLEKKSLSDQENQQWYFYRYYPSCSVYYDIERSLYYYLEGDDWIISASLPGNFEWKLGDYVKIDMDTDKPYIDHKKHVKKFPPEEPPKVMPKAWSKLIFFLLYGHAPR